MLLILTDRNDVHANSVIHQLDKISVPFYRLNLDRQSLIKTKIVNEGMSWNIVQESRNVEASDITCIWVRKCFVELSLEEQEIDEIDFKIWKQEWNKVLLGFYSRLRHLPWLNPWRKGYEAENKFLQMELASDMGLLLPPVVVSNDKEVLMGFQKRHGEVALKLMHQDIYRQDKKFVGLYVNKLERHALKKFRSSGENPIVLQRYVHKQFEVRYTVVGDKHFVCKIESQKSTKTTIDWRRYDIPNTPHYEIEPPDHVRRKVTALMRQLNLEYGALDFIVDPDNNWFFLEVNSMGQFLWIEELSGLKISQAIAEWAKKYVKLQTIEPKTLKK